MTRKRVTDDNPWKTLDIRKGELSRRLAAISDPEAQLAAVSAACDGLQILIERREIAARHPEAMAFAVMLTSAGFSNDSVNEYISDAQYDDRWIDDKGDRVRGEFFVLNMGKSYRESDIDAELDRATRRGKRTDGKRLVRATAYEGAAFAALGLQNGKKPTDKSDHLGWNGRDYVLVAGSSVRRRGGSRYLTALWFIGGQRRFGLYWDGNTWNASRLVLCVWE
jgi:hypothetical protein